LSSHTGKCAFGSLFFVVEIIQLKYPIYQVW